MKICIGAYLLTLLATVIANRKMHAGDDDDGDYDYDDDDDDGSGSAVAIPHAERAVRAVMSMPIAAGLDSGQFAQAGAREIVQMEPLRKKRREEGYYADDGYAVARGVRQKPGAAAGVVEEDPDSPFSSKFIDDYIDREKLLRSDPVYRFLQSVVARSAITTLIDETAMTAATAERIRQAKAEFQRQRRVLVDSPAEQERLKRARDQLDAASAELTSLQGELTLFEAAKARIVAAFERINNAPPSIEPIAFSFTLTYNDLFDYFTKAACARYGAGGYRRSLIETRSIAEIVHGDALRRGTVGPNQNTLQKAMPSTSYAALLWSALFIIAKNAALLERLRECGGVLFREPTAEYNQVGGAALGSVATAACFAGSPGAHAGASAYASDLVALANLVFDDDNPATENLLIESRISQLLWAHINKMITRAKLSAAPLDRPTAEPPTASTSTSTRTQKTVIPATVFCVRVDVDVDAVGGSAVGRSSGAADSLAR